jgi:hypothetical protein
VLDVDHYLDKHIYLTCFICTTLSLSEDYLQERSDLQKETR